MGRSSLTRKRIAADNKPFASLFIGQIWSQPFDISFQHLLQDIWLRQTSLYSANIWQKDERRSMKICKLGPNISITCSVRRTIWGYRTICTNGLNSSYPLTAPPLLPIPRSHRLNKLRDTLWLLARKYLRRGGGNRATRHCLDL
jgi:hypothetical protein